MKTDDTVATRQDVLRLVWGLGALVGVPCAFYGLDTLGVALAARHGARLTMGAWSLWWWGILLTCLAAGALCVVCALEDVVRRRRGWVVLYLIAAGAVLCVMDFNVCPSGDCAL